MKIMAYQRPDGQVGIRNHLLILPTSVCASETAVNISKRVKNCVALSHQHGCCQVGADYLQTLKTLIQFGKNPNVGAVLIVGLGCEGVQPDDVLAELKKTHKPVQAITIQACGGTLKTIEAGVRMAREMAQQLSCQTRQPCDVSALTLAIECGGSDPTSGIASNPAAGVASDLLIAAGGTAILSETTEFIGAEHLLAKRAVNEKVGQRLLEIVRQTEANAMHLGVDMRGGQPTPGNIAGGLTTIEEKSLGCIYKAGSAPLQGVLEYGDQPSEKGLFVMDTPGQDIESITGMLAGGAQLVIFTTGRGTPTGSPIAPVIKITGNSKTYANMSDNIDLNAGKIIDSGVTIEAMGQEIFEEMLAVANGKLTKAEILGHREFGIHKIAPTF